MEERTDMQDAQHDRLVGCFEQVFPNLSRSTIPTCTHSTVAAWDSIAQITLMSVIGEAFGIEIDFEEFEDATSFAAILEILRARTGNG
jgi:acyl carrier protein